MNKIGNITVEWIKNPDPRNKEILVIFSRFTSLLQYLFANTETLVTKLNAPPPLIRPQSDLIMTSRNIYLHDKQQARDLGFIFQSS